MARQVAITRSFRVNPDTAKSYAAKVCDFYDYCEDVLGTDPVFSRDNCAWFFEDYVSRGATKGRKPGALARLRYACGLVGVERHESLSGRCLRAGGATDLFAVNAGVLFVKSQGGWKSDAYQIYNRPTDAQRAALARVYAERRRILDKFDRHDFFRGIP